MVTGDFPSAPCYHRSHCLSAGKTSAASIGLHLAFTTNPAVYFTARTCTMLLNIQAAIWRGPSSIRTGMSPHHPTHSSRRRHSALLTDNKQSSKHRTRFHPTFQALVPTRSSRAITLMCTRGTLDIQGLAPNVCRYVPGILQERPLECIVYAIAHESHRPSAKAYSCY